VRLIDQATLDALGGSRPADTLTVWAWRGGELVLPEPLIVKEWSFEDQAGDNVKIGQRASFVIADTDGTLGAWRFDDPLGVGGTKLQVIYRVGGSGAINYAWFRVTGNTPTEYRESRVIDEYGYLEPDGSLPEHKRRIFLTTAAVAITAEDLTDYVDRDKFEAPQSPGLGATVVSEFRRLTGEYFPTVVDSGVTDTTVSRQLVYEKERLEACQDLLARISARYRMGGDGEAHIYGRRGPVVWRVEPNKGLINVSRGQSSDGLYNRWVVEGKNAITGDPFTAAVELTTGPLRYGGPHGKAQYFYTSDMITTQTDAVNYAIQLRDEFLGSLAVELAVDVIPRPELQADDRVEVGCPVPGGHIAYLRGEITSIKSSGNPIPRGTSMTVRCSYTDVVNALGRTEWANHLTDSMPDLTWDLMPGTWGQLPAVEWTDL
jgi:hypothetical protein